MEEGRKVVVVYFERVIGQIPLERQLPDMWIEERSIVGRVDLKYNQLHEAGPGRAQSKRAAKGQESVLRYSKVSSANKVTRNNSALPAKLP